MSKSNWQTLEEHRPRGATAQGGAVALVALTVGLIVVLRAVLFGLSDEPQTTAVPVAQANLTLALTATPTDPGPTWTMSPSPTRTPIPTATLQTLRLAVENDVYVEYASYFDGLPARIDGLTVITYTRHADVDNTLAASLAGAVLYWSSERPNEQAVLVREEPYAAVVNPALTRASWTVAQLAAVAAGKDQTYTFVTLDRGQVLRELLQVEETGVNLKTESTWGGVKEWVATQPEHVGIIPWEDVDFRVRVLPVEGQYPDPTDLQDYPLVRRLWLSSQGALSSALLDDLQAALHYDAAPTVVLAAVGDVMLGSYVGQTISNTSPLYPFEGQGIQEILAGADVTFGNLECAISDQGVQQDKTYTFRADPAVVEGLSFAGFDIMSLANNHTGDYGDQALLDTIGALRGAGIAEVGAGSTITEARTLRVVTANGLRIAFLAYNEILPSTFEATDTSPGSAWAREEAMVEDVQAARDLADVVVVSCHWGVEYSTRSNATQQSLARALAGAGADLVLGHHPHVLQGLGYLSDTLVAYSLGNFVFYDMLAAETSETLILRCVLDTSGVKTVELIPVIIANGQPALATAEVGDAIIERVLQTTEEQNGLPLPLS